MSNVARPAARQALRGCSRPSIHNRIPQLPAIIHQRTYVSETKPIHATVNVSTAIKEDQKAFIKNVGKKLEGLRLPGSGVSTDAAMSPVAGNIVHIHAKAF
jgi:cysteine desulfurase